MQSPLGSFGKSENGEIAMTNTTMSRRAALAFAIVGTTGLAPQVARADKGQDLPPQPITAALRDLKTVELKGQVIGIGHVDRTFEVTTADGRRASFSETNLRFKIDSSEFGPSAGRPVILHGGMIGDRVTVFVASAAEIGMLMRGCN
jgi:hypothetical protein